MSMAVKITKVVVDQRKMRAAAERANKRNLFRASGFIRTTARRSIRRRKKAAAPGKPPSTKSGLIRNAIIFAVDTDGRGSVIGPTARDMDGVAAVHEHGNSNYKGGRFAARPFMKPAFQKALASGKIPEFWKNSISS